MSTRMSVTFRIVPGMFLTFFQCLLMNVTFALVSLSYMCNHTLQVYEIGLMDLNIPWQSQRCPFSETCSCVWVEMSTSFRDSYGCSYESGDTEPGGGLGVM